MDSYFKTDALAVGYDRKALIRDINIELNRGEILTLIGPNGAGKSTILKTIIGQLPRIRGAVYIASQNLSDWDIKEMSKHVSVLLTDRIKPELTTCEEVVAMGRYPYTNMFGRLTAEDMLSVYDALDKIHALDLARKDFKTLSDGQRQRIMLARAICQEPELLILDEPTAYLDIRYKIELMDILRDLAKSGVTIIMSLHEIDLAIKISDRILCVKGDTIKAFGTTDEIIKNNTIDALYDMENGSYDMLFGSIEFNKPKGDPKMFVVAGSGYGIPVYRELQKRGIPFATGILFENDVDYFIARHLSDSIVTTPAFGVISSFKYEEAAWVLGQCEAVIDSGTPIGVFNRPNHMLLELAREKNLPIYRAAK